MTATDSTGRLRPVLARLARCVAAGEVDGAALAVAVGGEQVAEGYWGEAAPGRPAATETLWPLASIAKSYTAATVMALVERGDLTLSTTARSLLPRFDGEGRERVTLRHLLTHTAGLLYESPEMEELLRRQTPLAAIVDEVYTRPLLFPPGSRFGYSDLGYALAARMAEAATGRPFPDLVRELLLEPAGLRDTYLLPPPEQHGRLARVAGALASGTAGAMYNSPYALALAHPAFGVVASARDLLRFGLLFAPGGRRRVHSEATVRAMATDQTGGHAVGHTPGGEPDTHPTAPQPWGLGFVLPGAWGTGAGDLASPRSFSHGGATGCLLLVDPAYDLTVAFVSNKHLRADPARWERHVVATINGVIAALTRRAA